MQHTKKPMGRNKDYVFVKHVFLDGRYIYPIHPKELIPPEIVENEREFDEDEGEEPLSGEEAATYGGEEAIDAKRYDNNYIRVVCLEDSDYKTSWEELMLKPENRSLFGLKGVSGIKLGRLLVTSLPLTFKRWELSPLSKIVHIQEDFFALELFFISTKDSVENKRRADFTEQKAKKRFTNKEQKTNV